MSTGVDPSRKVPKGLGDTDMIWGYTTSEITTTIGGLFIGMLLTELLPSSLSGYGPLLLVFGFFLGVFVVYITPNHLEPTEWLGAMGHYIVRPTKVQHLSLSDGMAREQKDVMQEAEVYELNERTQELTWIDQIHKNAGAVERVDGVLVGGVKVEPSNMALASDERWNQMIEQWQTYLDNTVEYPLQIYVSSTDFPVEEYIQHYQRRLNDSDMQSRPILQELLRDFLSWYPEYIQYQGTKKNEIYILFPVREDEVIGTDLEEESIVEQLAELPVIGEKIKGIAGASSDEDENVTKAKMFAELNHRVREARNQGIRPITGCKSRRLSGFELAKLVKEYWQGREFEMEENAVKQQPVSIRDGDNPVDPEEVATDQGYSGTE